MRRFIVVFLCLFAVSFLPARAEEEWRPVDPENLALMDTAYGRIAMELSPRFAPAHVARFKALARAHFYDGQSFYRVIDGFVAQGGIGEGDDKKLSAWPPLKAEMETPRDAIPFFSLKSPDLFAPDTGFSDGFAAARDDASAWLVHCYGALAFARDDAPDTAASEFYIVIGHAPRRLDRIMSSIGRVIDGMDVVQKFRRGDPEVESGVIQDPSKRDLILSAVVAADLPEVVRPRYEVMRTDTEAFAKHIEERRVPEHPFFFRKPPPVLDVCNVTVPVRRAEAARPPETRARRRK